jgi:Raf kinase inhibitor-like YbhB/YbcL family protein
VNTLRALPATAPLTLTFLLIFCLAGSAMELTSPEIGNGARLSLAQIHTRCGGENRSPALHWSGAPTATRSFAVTLFDPDAGGGAGFWHWIVFDIPGVATGLPEATGDGIPSGMIQAKNDFGEPDYGGACPPPGSGTHHYVITLYALGAPRLPFGRDGKSNDIAAYLKSHALATASLVGTYQR